MLVPMSPSDLLVRMFLGIQWEHMCLQKYVYEMSKDARELTEKVAEEINPNPKVCHITVTEPLFPPSQVLILGSTNLHA
jgi:hypothetical protein